MSFESINSELFYINVTWLVGQDGICTVFSIIFNTIKTFLPTKLKYSI